MDREQGEQVQPLDLRTLLRDPMIIECHLWFEVGLELGLAVNKLKEIESDYLNISDRKREMWNFWLTQKFKHDRSLKMAHEAIREVQRRGERKQNIQKIEDEDQKACTAIHELKRSLEEFEDKNDLIAHDLKGVVSALTRVNNWLSSTEEWEREDEVWELGKTATLRDNLRDASERKEFHTSFVQQFLQQKGKSHQHMSDIEIDHYLRKELMEIELARSKKVRGRYAQRKSHDKKVQDLLRDIERSEKLIMKRIRIYQEIVVGLKSLGVDKTKLDELLEQLGNVKTTLHEYIKAKNDCTRVQEEGRKRLQERRQQVERLNKSLKDVTSKLTSSERELIKLLENIELTSTQMWAGAATGAVIGTFIFPVVGTIIGGVVGGAGGLMWHNKEAELKASQETSKRLIQSYEKMSRRAKAEHEQVLSILREDDY